MYFSNAGKPGTELERRTTETASLVLIAAGVTLFLIANLESGEPAGANFLTMRQEASLAFDSASDTYRELAGEVVSAPFALFRSQLELASVGVSPRFFAPFNVVPAESFEELSGHMHALGLLVRTLDPEAERLSMSPTVFRIMSHWESASQVARLLSVVASTHDIIRGDVGLR